MTISLEEAIRDQAGRGYSAEEIARNLRTSVATVRKVVGETLPQKPALKVSPIEKPAAVRPVVANAQPRILLGKDAYTKEAVYWDMLAYNNPHALVAGGSGGGKTHLLQCMMLELARRGYPLVVLDQARSFTDPEFLEATGASVISVLADGLSLSTFRVSGVGVGGPNIAAMRICDTFARQYNIGVQQKATLYMALKDCYADRGIDQDDSATWSRQEPTFEQLQAKLEAWASDRLSDRRETAGTLLGQLLFFFEQRVFRNTGKRIEWADTLTSAGITIFSLDGLYGEAVHATSEFILWDLYWALFELGEVHATTRVVAVLDEAHEYNLSEKTPVGQWLRLARKFGGSIWLSSQQTSDFTPLAYNNTATKVFFATANPASAAKSLSRSVNMTSDRLTEELASLKRGQAVVLCDTVARVVDITPLDKRRDEVEN